MNTESIILVPIFIIILLVTYKAIHSGLSLGPARTLVLSVCVSLLSVIGMSRCLKGSLDVILLPYTAMAVALLVLLLLLLIAKFFKGSAERFSESPHRERKTESKITPKRSRHVRKS